MLTTRQARKALKQTNQLIGPLQRVPGGWTYSKWNEVGAWVRVFEAAPFRRVQTARRNSRLLRVAMDMGIDTAALTATVFDCDGKGRAETILARASRRAWNNQKAA